MQETALDHVQLAMPPGREDEACAFYEGVLGIPRVSKHRWTDGTLHVKGQDARDFRLLTRTLPVLSLEL